MQVWSSSLQFQKPSHCRCNTQPVLSPAPLLSSLLFLPASHEAVPLQFNLAGITITEPSPGRVLQRPAVPLFCQAVLPFMLTGVVSTFRAAINAVQSPAIIKLDPLPPRLCRPLSPINSRNPRAQPCPSILSATHQHTYTCAIDLRRCHQPHPKPPRSAVLM